MGTQEERVTTLEQTFAAFRKETATRTQEIEENTTIMLGVMRSGRTPLTGGKKS